MNWRAAAVSSILCSAPANGLTSSATALSLTCPRALHCCTVHQAPGGHGAQCICPRCRTTPVRVNVFSSLLSTARRRAQQMKLVYCGRKSAVEQAPRFRYWSGRWRAAPPALLRACRRWQRATALTHNSAAAHRFRPRACNRCLPRCAQAPAATAAWSPRRHWRKMQRQRNGRPCLSCAAQAAQRWRSLHRTVAEAPAPADNGPHKQAIAPAARVISGCA